MTEALQKNLSMSGLGKEGNKMHAVAKGMKTLSNLCIYLFLFLCNFLASYFHKFKVMRNNTNTQIYRGSANQSAYFLSSHSINSLVLTQFLDTKNRGEAGTYRVSRRRFTALFFPNISIYYME